MKSFNLLTSLRTLRTFSGVFALASSISVVSFATQAETLAIINAEIHTVAEQGVLSQGAVLVENGKITAVYANDQIPLQLIADKVIDAKGGVLTPGIIASNNTLGLVEVGAVSRTRDSADKKADITFDASLAFNPKSSLIPYARKGGITSSIVMPSGGEGVFSGQSFIVNLSAGFDSVIVSQHAVIADFGAKSKGSRAVNLQTFSNALEDASKTLAKDKKAKEKKEPKDKKEAKEPTRAQKVINAVVKGEKTLLAHADRATDILVLLALKKKYQLDLVLVGASDAILVADEIAQADVVVMTNALANLPTSFDSLHSSLSNVAQLQKAGVRVIISNSGESYNINQLRFDAGVAVANGLAKTDALAAITANVADAFKLNSGRIAVGKNADLVLWSNDPFEISSKVNALWINGQAVTTQSRQDALRNRYTSKSELPRAYIK
mgnify:CR=1 FL=1